MCNDAAVGGKNAFVSANLPVRTREVEIQKALRVQELEKVVAEDRHYSSQLKRKRGVKTAGVKEQINRRER